MIKKILLGLGLSIVSFIGFSNGLSVTPIGSGTYFFGGNNCSINSNLGISCFESSNIISSYNDYIPSISNIFWSINGIGVYYNGLPGNYQGLIDHGFYICQGDINSLISNFSILYDSDCNPGFSKVVFGSYQSFLDYIQQYTPKYFWNMNDDRLYGISLSVLYDDFYFSYLIDGYGSKPSNFTDMNLGFTGSDFSNVNFNNPYVLKNPFLGLNDDIFDGGIELNSNESALNYYESRYGWNENICYVGTDSLNYLYGQNGVSFIEGSGLSLFDVYVDLYGSGYELKWVGNWLNTWLLNYEQWFNSRGINAEGVGHPSWLSYYNSGTHVGDLYFDNLTFPFINQPVAFYFMSDYIDSKSPYSTMGSSVISYCNIKINGGSFEDIIDDSDKNNINKYTEQYNKNNGLKPDGSKYEYGYYEGSGVDLAFSGDVSIKNTLKNLFTEFDNTFSVLESTNNRILPSWLVSAFIFIVLFKIIRKK